MNRPTARTVAPGRRAGPLAAIALLSGLIGCVEVDGGAVELAWTLRTFGGNPTDCASTGIARVRICWAATGDAGTGGSTLDCLRGFRREFACEDSRGVTAFEIPPGPTQVWIEPVCGDGEPPPDTAYEVPAPVVRTIRTGDVATLGALLIVANSNTCVR